MFYFPLCQKEKKRRKNCVQGQNNIKLLVYEYQVKQSKNCD